MIPAMKLPSASMNLEKNVWADYVELSCITSQDYEVSLSDMVEIVRKEEPEGLGRGSEMAGEEDDVFHQKFIDIFHYLNTRKTMLDEWYPFIFEDEDTISLNVSELSSKQVLYLFLLYASNLSQFTRQEQSKLTRQFELLSKSVLECVFPTYTVEIYGTTAPAGTTFYGGKAIDRLEKLADSLNTQVTEITRKNERYTSPSGDGGLDLIGYARLEKGSIASPYIPMCFAQCACSVDEWKSKQSSIKYDLWNSRFCQLATYCEFIFIPFSLRGPDGKWASTEEDQIIVIPIDRIRFLHILNISGNDLAFFEQSEAYNLILSSCKAD